MLNLLSKIFLTQELSSGQNLIKLVTEIDAKLYKGKIVILVNEVTQSHAEFTTMCLQTAKNALVIGSQTSGADGNVSKIPFVGGFGSMITGLGVYYPDGQKHNVLVLFQILKYYLLLKVFELV